MNRGSIPELVGRLNLYSLMQPEVWSSLEDGALLLTANARSARWCRQEYGRRQQEGGRSAWTTPLVLSFDAWLHRCWSEWLLSAPGVPTELLLSSDQEHLIWEQIIAASDGRSELLDLPGTARAADSAWELVQDWDLGLRSADWEQSEDTAAFRTWAQTFERMCRDNRWLTSGTWLQSVTGLFERGEMKAPAQLWYLGFDEFTPRQQRLLQVLRGAGTQVTERAAPNGPGSVRCFRLPSPEAELEAAARWARERLEFRNDEPSAAPIGVVVLGIESSLAQIERTFMRVFHPDRVPGNSAARAFDISLGPPLGEYPLIDAALMVLELAARGAEPQEWSVISRLLRSPFLYDAVAETGARAVLELRLRENGLTHLRLQDLQAHASATCPGLAQRLQDIVGAIPQASGRSSYSLWSQAIAKLLRAAGWPGPRPLDSAEYQTLDAWQTLLSRLSAIDQVSGAVTFSEARRRLVRLAARTPYQPQSPTPPVQIMGWLEAAGLEFGALWVLNLQDQIVPSRPAPSPFIPINLQRNHGLPHSSPQRESEFAQRRMQRLLASACEVVLSYPERNEDIDQRPSPLLADYEIESPPQLPRGIHESVDMESLEDRTGPPAVEAVQRGGVSILQDQVVCGFRAFARHRLRARAPEPANAWLTPAQRGSLLHDALEQVWRELRGSNRLVALSPVELAHISAECAEAAARESAALRGRPELARLEKSRLTRTLLAWLEIEKVRPPFHVKALEQRVDAEVAGLQLHVKLDRLDSVIGPGGKRRLILLDYKSGLDSAAWDPAELRAPQLPLYATTLADSEVVDAIAIAQVRPGNMEFVGIAAAEGILPVRTPGKFKSAQTISARIEDWRRSLETVARSYLAGVSPVQPLSPTDCRHCDFPSFCRIDPEAAEFERAADNSEDGFGGGSNE